MIRSDSVSLAISRIGCAGSGVYRGMREVIEIPKDKVAHLAGCKFDCTHCLRTKPAADFGMRTMPDGSIRNQAQCKVCRSRYGKK